jgi:copper(I)-binding protein
MMQDLLSKISYFLRFIMFASLMASCSLTYPTGLRVTGVWARPGLADGNSAVFFVVENPGDADILSSASSDVATAVELHRTTMQDGIMKMEHQMQVPVPKGKTEFKPGDLHVMLIGLQHDLRAGDSFTLTLHFDNSGDQEFVVEVKEP